MIKDLSAEIRQQLQTGQIGSSFEVIVEAHCLALRDGASQIILDADLIRELIRLPITPASFDDTPPVPEFG